MTDRKALFDSNETPDDVATLYLWANLHGAKYRDFSASRAQSREQARLNASQAAQLEQEQVRRRAEGEQAEQARRAAETARAEEQAHIAELAAQQAAQLVARQSAQLAAQQRSAQQALPPPFQQPVQQRPVQPQSAQQQPVQQRPVQQQFIQQQRPQQQTAQAAPQFAQPQFAQPLRQPTPEMPQAPRPDRFTAPAAAYAPPQSTFPASQPLRPAAAPQQYAPMREEPLAPPPAVSWAAPEPRENPLRPAWLATRPEPVSQPAALQAPDDTIQGSRDRLTSRWFALKGIFDGDSAGAPAVEAQSAPVASRAPVLGVFSLAGGVGKTSLVATLGRALSARGERVLLVDTAAFGLLPFFFGARDQRPGQLRTFTPPASSGDAPIQMVTVDPDAFGAENAAQEGLASEIGKYSRGVGRVIVDLATASGSTTRRILKLQPLILVPVVPDMNSVVSVSSIDAFFERNAGGVGKSALPYYVLNQFDPSLPLHLDVREVLREQLGERLLPFALRRAPAVSEALAEGMTVMDYAPNSTVAEDFGSLAGWVKTLSAPAGSGFRGVRWSER